MAVIKVDKSYTNKDKNMDTDELIIENQQKQLTQEIGKLFEEKTRERNDQSLIKYSKSISKKLSINYGSSLCLIFWIEELLEIYPQKKNKDFLEKNIQQRLTHLARLVKLAGGEKAVHFCCSLLPQYAAENFISVVAKGEGWKAKKFQIEDED
jgi:hypothetical protein